MAARNRRIVLAEAVSTDAAEVALDAEAAHYVTHVLRLADGASIDALERGGHLIRGVLRWRGGQPWLTECAIAPVEAPTRELVVAAALIKASRWEWLVEKAVELGATAIAPWAAARSVVQVPERKVADRVARWQRIADGAARQCGRPDTVVVHPPGPLQEAFDSWSSHTWWHADEAANDHRWPDANADTPLVLAFGPEGGFTEAERDALHDAGALPFGLGSSLLRAETAVVCALSGLRLRAEGLTSDP